MIARQRLHVLHLTSFRNVSLAIGSRNPRKRNSQNFQANQTKLQCAHLHVPTGKVCETLSGPGLGSPVIAGVVELRGNAPCWAALPSI